MFEILKKKIEIVLTIFVLFQGHALYVKHHKIQMLRDAHAKATVQTLQNHQIDITTSGTNNDISAQIPTDIPAEVSNGLPIDINNPDIQTNGLSKEQAIDLINSLPD